MSENPVGVLVIRDELAGLLASFERNGHEGERQFYLTAWNGHSSYPLDRIGRGTIYLPHSCLSLLGGIQPIRLRQYLASLSEDHLTNDGMIQRLQVVVWPDTRPNYVYTDRPPDACAEQLTQRIFDQILKVDPPEPFRFRFSPDAQDLFVPWLEQLEGRIRGDELDPTLAAHLSKYRGLMPSLALIFEIAERASRGFVGFEGLMVGGFVPTVSFDNAICADITSLDIQLANNGRASLQESRFHAILMFLLWVDDLGVDEAIRVAHVCGLPVPGALAEFIEESLNLGKRYSKR